MDLLLLDYPKKSIVKKPTPFIKKIRLCFVGNFLFGLMTLACFLAVAVIMNWFVDEEKVTNAMYNDVLIEEVDVEV